jgi:hypothetical protein
MAAKKKTAKAKTKKIKIEEMSQTDGMAVDESQEEFVPSTLDQVFGDDGTAKYKTLNNEVYEQVLNNMSKADMKSEAIRVGLLPIDNVDQLKNRLMREFTAHVSSYKRPSIKIQDTPVSDESRKILEEGR